MKKKLYDYVELLDFKREYYDDSKRNDNYGDTATVRYTNPNSSGQGVYIISAGHMDRMDYVAIDLTDESGFQFDSFTGGIKNGDLQNFYKRALGNNDFTRDELIAALIGYYIYKLPKKVRDVKALKLDKETADVWGDIISEL